MILGNTHNEAILLRIASAFSNGMLFLGALLMAMLGFVAILMSLRRWLFWFRS